MNLIRQIGFILGLLGLLLTGCGGTEPPPEGVFHTPAAPPTPTEGAASSPDTDADLPQPVTLRIWLPPEMDPAAGTPAAELLGARLEAFTALHPDIRVEVRVKALSGRGGLLESLAATQAVTPRALPDLVALPRPDLEAAAIKGLLIPLRELNQDPTDGDWYPYAQQLARLDDTFFGIPFAGDVLVLVYRTETLTSPPDSWDAALDMAVPLLFSAASPRADFTLALYMASGGRTQDAQGRPTVSPSILQDVLAFYEKAQQANLLPVWITELTTDTDVLRAFQQGQVDQAVVWFSRYQGGDLEGAAFAPLPTSGGVPFTLASGWLWALTNPYNGYQSQSTELAYFLTSADFLAEWTAAMGYLPPRVSGLAETGVFPSPALLDRLSLSAQVLPPFDVLNTLGPAFQRAAVAVLKGQADSGAAAQEVADHLGIP